MVAGQSVIGEEMMAGMGEGVAETRREGGVTGIGIGRSGTPAGAAAVSDLAEGAESRYCTVQSTHVRTENQYEAHGVYDMLICMVRS